LSAFTTESRTGYCVQEIYNKLRRCTALPEPVLLDWAGALDDGCLGSLTIAEKCKPTTRIHKHNYKKRNKCANMRHARTHFNTVVIIGNCIVMWRWDLE